MRKTLYAPFLILTSVFVVANCAQFANAATFNDPTWPCQQRKVEQLSLGLMWPKPLKDGSEKETALPPDAAELAGRLELRRISLEEADKLVATFVEDHPDVTTDLMGQIFAVVFERLGNARHKVIVGIGRYSEKQIALSKRIDETRAEMDQIMAASDPDYDKVDKLEEKLDWDERVYKDRSTSLTYVCETPVLIEKRLYALAQILLKHAPE
ncbi:hypothetical protein [Roseibium aggregatum]|uniref:Secreted protein n=1 Tax=Roseibium aggregatum TaxID=187304 RepID=A0A926NY41_9HYPH|nr:hypothetical protein [Roseibium aggregatum]MBD1545398.1 hypothetical protein [Roseibium aggregatum]